MSLSIDFFKLLCYNKCIKGKEQLSCIKLLNVINTLPSCVDKFRDGGRNMKKCIDVLRVLLVALGGSLASWLGGIDALLVTLLVMMGIDIFTGVIVSWVTKTTSSKVMFKGIIKKIVEIVIVILTVQLDKLIVGELGLNVHLREYFIVYVMLDELLSIIENSCMLGVFPEGFRDKFIQVKEEFVTSLGTAILTLVGTIKEIIIKSLSNTSDKDNNEDK